MQIQTSICPIWKLYTFQSCHISACWLDPLPGFLNTVHFSFTNLEILKCSPDGVMPGDRGTGDCCVLQWLCDSSTLAMRSCCMPFGISSNQPINQYNNHDVETVTCSSGPSATRHDGINKPVCGIVSQGFEGPQTPHYLKEMFPKCPPWTLFVNVQYSD